MLRSSHDLQKLLKNQQQYVDQVSSILWTLIYNLMLKYILEPRSILFLFGLLIFSGVSKTESLNKSLNISSQKWIDSNFKVLDDFGKIYQVYPTSPTV